MIGYARALVAVVAAISATVGCGLAAPAPSLGQKPGMNNRPVADTLASKFVGRLSHAQPSEVIVTSRTGAPVQLPGTQTIATMVVGGKHVSLARPVAGTTLQAIVDGNRSNPVADVAQNDMWWAQAGAPASTPGAPPADEYQSMQFGLARMDVAGAWKVTQGNPDLVVAVLDTGVDYNHPEFAGRIVKGPNFAYRKPEPTTPGSGAPGASVQAGNDAPSPAAPRQQLPGVPQATGPDDPIDDFGHGTHVAGIIAAAADGRGVVGVAPRVKIMAVKVLGPTGGGTTWDIAQGIHHAVSKGAKIVNLSLGGPTSNGFVELLVADARAKGVLVVAAAGNNGWNLDGPPVNAGIVQVPHTIYPAMYKGAMAVGATDDQDKLGNFSNYGKKVAVTAPGVKILSTMPTTPCAMSVSGGFLKNYDVMSGTSMAAPMAAGAAALVMSAHPDWTPDQVEEALMRTADKVGPEPFFGKGRVNVGKAVL
ncbi:MAG: S8 family serine peptidase [Candidatus Sericytochromatia bacterium]|nr:S8 family serine peptidase [Candidatus Tanganyikabacteria bacterium]